MKCFKRFKPTKTSLKIYKWVQTCTKLIPLTFEQFLKIKLESRKQGFQKLGYITLYNSI